MKAVILAAGKGTRMRPLTEDTPKPLLPVAGKPIIQHNIDILESEVDEIIIIAGYKIDQFKQKFGESNKITVVEQENANGTADAALCAQEHIEEKALILNGDDIYGKELEEAIQRDAAVLAAQSPEPEKYGVVEFSDGEITDIQEKPDNPSSNFVNTGAYVVQSDFFNLLENVRESERGEYEITDAIDEYIEERRVEVVETKRWLPCSYPWQLIDANEVLMENIEREINGEVADSATVKGNVIIAKDARVRENSVVEGPAIIKEGCTLGPNAYIRANTVLEENVEVGNSEVKNSVIREKSCIPHFNYVGDSYIGRKSNLGAGVKTANLRNDDEKVKMKVKDSLMETDRRKLGAIIGSEASIGVNTAIKPGRRVGFKALTDAQEKISEDLPTNTVLKNGEIHENRN